MERKNLFNLCKFVDNLKSNRFYYVVKYWLLVVLNKLCSVIKCCLIFYFFVFLNVHFQCLFLFNRYFLNEIVQLNLNFFQLLIFKYFLTVIFIHPYYILLLVFSLYYIVPDWYNRFQSSNYTVNYSMKNATTSAKSIYNTLLHSLSRNA